MKMCKNNRILIYFWEITNSGVQNPFNTCMTSSGTVILCMRSDQSISVIITSSGTCILYRKFVESIGFSIISSAALKHNQFHTL